MNVRLYDGTVRCSEHMDASSHQGQTADPCAYCPTGVSLDKNIEHSPELADTVKLVRRIRKPRLPQYTLYGHREGLRRNDLVTLASALWIEASHRDALSAIAGTLVNGKVVPVNF